MVNILQPTGIEKPEGAEKHSRAQILRNLDRTNKIEQDRRSGANIPFGHAGVTAGFQSIAGSDKPVNIDDQILRGGMSFESSSGGRFIIPRDGIYEVRVKGYATGGSAYDYMVAAYVNSDKIEGTEVFDYKQTTSDYKQHAVTAFAFTAGQKIGLGMTSPNSTWGTDGWNGAWLEVLFMME